jgi:hypothetical protein
METRKFECIKGLADSENINVIVMQGDIVTLDGTDDGEVCVEGIAGWCKGRELTFSPRQFVEHFKVIGITYKL